MSTARTDRFRQTIGRVKKTWAELDYAQRRLLEIRTGIPFLNARGPSNDPRENQ